MADIPRTDVKKEQENGKIEVVQGNIDIVQLKFLESINNNLNAIRKIIDDFVKPTPPK